MAKVSVHSIRATELVLAQLLVLSLLGHPVYCCVYRMPEIISLYSIIASETKNSSNQLSYSIAHLDHLALKVNAGFQEC